MHLLKPCPHILFIEPSMESRNSAAKRRRKFIQRSKYTSCMYFKVSLKHSIAVWKSYIYFTFIYLFMRCTSNLKVSCLSENFAGFRPGVWWVLFKLFMIRTLRNKLLKPTWLCNTKHNIERPWPAYFSVPAW